MIAAAPGSLTDAVNVEGVDEILAVKVDRDEFENDVYQRAVEQLIAERSPDVVLLGFTVNSMGYAPALAAKLGTGFASDVFAVRDEDGALVAERSFYRDTSGRCCSVARRHGPLPRAPARPASPT